MNLSSINDKRRLVPRWRSFKNTSFSSDLAVSPSSTNIIETKDDSFLHFYCDSWRKNKNVDIAAEIVFHCITIGKPNKALAQAYYLKSKSNLLSVQLQRVIESIINNGNIKETSLIQTQTLTDLKNQIYQEIHYYKHMLHKWPKSAIYWVELARLYSSLGELERSYKAIKIALNLSSSNRFIIRSAIRYFAHISDYDELSKVFSNYNALYHDPWVLAPFISLQDKLYSKYRNMNIKKARILLDKSNTLHSTELAGSLATLELNNGAIKKAKKLFKTSINNPNDNSLAQISWAEADGQIGRIGDISAIDVPFDYEIRTRESFRSNRIQESLQNCIQWMIDEPFSPSPAISGSFISLSYLDNFEYAKQFCEVGLNANPTDKALLNNMAVLQARSGSTDNALKSFRKIEKIEKNSAAEITHRATVGLIYFRSNLITKGRDSYNESINLANKLDLPNLKAIAAINLAEEEMHYGEKSKEEIAKIFENNIPSDLHHNIKPIYHNAKQKLSRYSKEQFKKYEQ